MTDNQAHAPPASWRQSVGLIEQHERYEQIRGGCLREVRSNVTLPTVESNLAVVGPMSMRVPSWKGLPQPAGGFPLPSDSGCFARQNVPSILAHSMPQCVYSRYDRPACACVVVRVDQLVCELQPATATAMATEARQRMVIRPNYVGEDSSSHAPPIMPGIGPPAGLIKQQRPHRHRHAAESPWRCSSRR
jgi:hypothetical protein